MATTQPWLTELSALRDRFREALRNFAIDPRQQFTVVYSQVAVSSSSSPRGTLASATTAAPAAPDAVKTLFILDSSFNPPSRAHGWIAQSALVEHLKGKGRGQEETRLLLLLATRNADKPSPSATDRARQRREGGFEDRMVMMAGLARDLLAEIAGDVDPGRLVIDIGLTKMPYFVGKAEAIDQSGVYGGSGGKGVEQVHLVGFDTLTRIFERKYYAELGLEVLTPFLARHRLRVLTRPDDDDDDDDDETKTNGSKDNKGWGSVREQREWLQRMKRGDLAELGCKQEWSERIELVEARDARVLGVSSTKAREAVKSGRWADVDRLLGPTVVAWIRETGLYQE